MRHATCSVTHVLFLKIDPNQKREKSYALRSLRGEVADMISFILWIQLTPKIFEVKLGDVVSIFYCLEIF